MPLQVAHGHLLVQLNLAAHQTIHNPIVKQLMVVSGLPTVPQVMTQHVALTLL
jgi:hypothetical protein